MEHKSHKALLLSTSHWPQKRTDKSMGTGGEVFQGFKFRIQGHFSGQLSLWEGQMAPKSHGEDHKESLHCPMNFFPCENGLQFYNAIRTHLIGFLCYRQVIEIYLLLRDISITDIYVIQPKYSSIQFLGARTGTARTWDVETCRSGVKGQPQLNRA